MTKKNLLLMLFAVGLALIYVIWFTDWFRPKTVQISYTNRDLHPNRRHGNSLPNLMFHIKPRIRFTELKVVPLADYETNQSAVAVWHLVSDSNSVPVATFFYGQNIGGMRPAINRVHAEALKTKVTYRMSITAGHAKGQRDFELN